MTLDDIADLDRIYLKLAGILAFKKLQLFDVKT